MTAAAALALRRTRISMLRVAAALPLVSGSLQGMDIRLPTSDVRAFYIGMSITFQLGTV
jgi:hypothetical protein